MPEDDKVSDKLRARFPGGMTPVAMSGRYVGMPLYRYDIQTQSDLREAFEVIDGIQEIIEGLDLADKGAASVYYTGDLSVAEFQGGAFDQLGAVKQGMSTADYIENQIQEAKEKAWAKADVLYSMMSGMIIAAEEAAAADASARADRGTHWTERL